MKTSYIMLGLALLIALFASIPNGAAADLADYCDEQCSNEACYAACGREPDPADCVTVRDDPNTPEDESYVSPGCDALIAYQECCSECNREWEDCWNACMRTGAIVDEAMILTLLHTDVCPPGAIVLIEGVVSDAKGQALSGVRLDIEVEGQCWQED